MLDSDPQDRALKLGERAERARPASVRGLLNVREFKQAFIIARTSISEVFLKDNRVLLQQMRRELWRVSAPLPIFCGVPGPRELFLYLAPARQPYASLVVEGSKVAPGQSHRVGERSACSPGTKNPVCSLVRAAWGRRQQLLMMLG